MHWGGKLLAYVKDEGSNQNTISVALKLIICYDVLGLKKSFKGYCFGHVFSKVCQYVTIDEKVCKDLQYVSIKVTQGDLHKCITWPNQLGKGGQEWEKTCVNLGFHKGNWIL